MASYWRGNTVKPLPRVDLEPGGWAKFQTVQEKVRWYQDAYMAGNITMSLEELNRLIDWKVFKLVEVHQKKGDQMQYQFSLELRVDFADIGKLDAMKKAFQQSGTHLMAVASLLTDKVKPQIAIFADDFFTGHTEIKLFDDDIEKGKKMLEEAGDSSQDTPISDELINALRNKGG